MSSALYYFLPRNPIPSKAAEMPPRPPNSKDPTDEATPPPTASGAAGRTRTLGGGAPARGRILIVDDEANARAALSEILHDEGYATETAADGFKALGKLEDFHPDVI